MYIRVCENPLRLKIKGRWQYVACGKCPTCINRRASRVVERLEQESQCHPYTVFFTLTYAEKYVPKLWLSADGTYLCDPKRETLVTLDPEKFKASSRLYVHRRKEIPYIYMKDLQDFFKRLRYYIDTLLKNESKENKKIRYYAVSEYGPATFRPHYHGLIWTDSKIIARRIHELVREAWTLGRIDAQLAFGKSESYVARYVNCVASLPKIYLHPLLRPKSVCSQSPAIGTLEAGTQEVREIFERGSVERVLQSQRNHKSKVSPLWRTFENRLFPKIVGFDHFTHTQRVTLYSVYCHFPADSFEGFVEWIIEFRNKPYNTWLSDYLNKLLDADMQHSAWLRGYSRLRSLYYTSSRVYHQRRVFGVSLDYYVSKIEQYYNNKARFALKNFYGFQEKYASENQTSLPLIFMYESSEDFWSIPNYQLETFGFDCSTALTKSAGLTAAKKGENINTSEFVTLNAKIYFDSNKSKKRNDRLEAVKNKDKFNFNLNKHYE